jgi:putative heme iron utilization protein
MQELDPQLLARVSLRGEAEQVSRESQEFELVRRQYLEKYPQSAYTFQLGDFSFYRISPKVARYVAGFAKAFNLAAIDLIRPEKFSLGISVNRPELLDLRWCCDRRRSSSRNGYCCWSDWEG